jgi:hypothetical protein
LFALLLNGLVAIGVFKVSGVKVGYVDDKGTGIGGGFTIRSVPALKEIGMTPANGKFTVQGKKKEVSAWLSAHGGMKVTTHEDFKEFHVTVGVLHSTNAAQIYLEEFAKGFVPAGGAMARVRSLFVKDDWAVVFRIGAIHPKIPHGTFPSGSIVSNVVSWGKNGKLAVAQDATETGLDIVDGVIGVADLFK